MNFLNPTKITLSLFVLFLLIFFSPFIVSEIPFVGNLVFSFYIFSISPLFIFFHGLGINVGRVGGGGLFFFGFPSPNLLGWILIILINSLIYYFVASLVSVVVKDLKKRRVLYSIIISVIIIYSLVLGFGAVLSKKHQVNAGRVQECAELATKRSGTCHDKCNTSFESNFRVAEENQTEYWECIAKCDNDHDVFITQCNS